jgi:hypothetical protein
LANNFLQILHQLGKRSQSLLKPNNNKTRLTTAKLFVGVEVWEATLFPFLCKIASEREKKGKTSTFFFLDMTALLVLMNKDFLEVVWPGREVRANIICDAEYPVVVTYNSTSMQLRATFSCLAVGFNNQLVVSANQTLFSPLVSADPH